MADAHGADAVRLAITSLGMVTSVGRDSVTACAALRAGLRRTAELSSLEVFDEDGEPIPIVGCPIRGFTDGFLYVGAWMRMGLACLRDVVRYGQLPAPADTRFWQATGLALVVPRIDADRFQVPEEYGLDAIRDSYVLPLLRASGLPISPAFVWTVTVSHAGAAAAVGQAAGLIADGRLERVIVLAVDSYLDRFTLEWLAAGARLKTEDAPAALVPGEAAAAFLLEAATIAEGRGGRSEAIVLGAATGVEPDHLGSDRPSTGAELARVISLALGADAPLHGDLYADLNGEPWRAYEFGSAQARLAGWLAEDVQLVLPCSSIGETGAASGAVGVCSAVRAFVRGHASGPRAMVVSSSEYGDVGAVLLAQAAA